MSYEKQDVNLEKNHETKAKNLLLGQGSYGCVYYPGINCAGKINKKNYVTKLQEISFYSVNEINIGKYIKKFIRKYSSIYAPIIKYCTVSFQTIQKSELNISECETLFSKTTNNSYDGYDDYGYNYYNDSNNYDKNKLHTKYYLMYMNYIVNKTFKKYFEEYKIFDLYVVDLIKTSVVLITSIGHLVNIKIIHNDLHVNNILINLKKKKPIIIDFGLSMYYDKCYKYQKKTIDFEYLKMLVFDFRDDQYHIILEKRFISFIIYNKSDYYNVNISNNFVKNELTKSIIDLFIKDSYESISNQTVIAFNEVELAEYYKSLKQFYYQFLNKHKYPNYTVIINYLLQYVFKYTDLYSLVFDIFYINKSMKFETNSIVLSHSVGERAGIVLSHSVGKRDDIGLPDRLGESDGIGLTDSVGESVDVSKLFLNFFLQLLKKNLHPNPIMRLKYDELIKIYDYIIYTIKKSEVNLVYDTFIKGFSAFLISNSINLKIVFDKRFSHLDFRIIINNTMVDFIKNKF
jgi:serine/threonine protein kinase